MAQHDYNLANQNGAAFRADLNAALEAIQSVNSGATEPASTVAYMPWADTNSGLWKVRNAADSAWVSVMALTASRVDTAAGTSYNNSGSDLAATNVKDALDEIGSAIVGGYTKTNILGPVSQSAGVPTGAIIERGSNANGEFVKFADGTLWTRSTLAGETDVTISANGWYRSATILSPLPIVSVSASRTIALGSQSGSSAIMVPDNLSTNSYSFRLLAGDSITSAPYSVVLIFYGRWY